MKALAVSKSPAENDAMTTATRLIAEMRIRCVTLGLTPRQFAELLLPEALLAMMVAGMRQEDVQEVFQRFASDEVPAWFLQVKRHTGYCDCAREAYGEHLAGCPSSNIQELGIAKLM